MIIERQAGSYNFVIQLFSSILDCKKKKKKRHFTFQLIVLFKKKLILNLYNAFLPVIF